MILKTRAELSVMHRANAIVQETLRMLAEYVRPGVSTAELDRLAEAFILSKGGKPAFKGYHGYPATLCTSVNDVIVHGIPSERCVLKEGDIISLDCGVVLDGYYGDAAVTLPVGKISPQAQRLLQVTRECLQLAVDCVRPGKRLGDVSATIQRHAEAAGFSVVREFVGHGIGRSLHEDPQVCNYGVPGTGPELKPGLVLAIEPMVNEGRPGVRLDADGWTARTEDGKLSAHFEYSVAVTDDGPWVLGVEG